MIYEFHCEKHGFHMRIEALFSSGISTGCPRCGQEAAVRQPFMVSGYVVSSSSSGVTWDAGRATFDFT